MRKREKRKRV